MCLQTKTKNSFLPQHLKKKNKKKNKKTIFSTLTNHSHFSSLSLSLLHSHTFASGDNTIQLYYGISRKNIFTRNTRNYKKYYKQKRRQNEKRNHEKKRHSFESLGNTVISLSQSLSNSLSIVLKRKKKKQKTSSKKRKRVLHRVLRLCRVDSPFITSVRNNS